MSTKNPVDEYMKQFPHLTRRQAELGVDEMNADSTRANAFGMISTLFNENIGDFPGLAELVRDTLVDRFGVAIGDPRSLVGHYRTVEWASKQIPILVDWCRAQLEKNGAEKPKPAAQYKYFTDGDAGKLDGVLNDDAPPYFLSELIEFATEKGFDFFCYDNLMIRCGGKAYQALFNILSPKHRDNNLKLSITAKPWSFTVEMIKKPVTPKEK